MKRLLSLLILLVSVGAAAAQNTPAIEDEALDPDVEERVKEISSAIRCVVCKNQSIAESDAGLAKDMRNLVRERVEAGDSNEEVEAYLVDRYGEFVLLNPSFSAKNLGLWFGPFLALVLALLGAIYFIRSKRQYAPADVPLSEEEQSELQHWRNSGSE